MTNENEAYDPFEDDDNQDFCLDGEGVSEDDINEGGGGRVDKKGKYHFEVRDVVPQLDTKNAKGEDICPKVRFDLIVAHDVEGQSPMGSILFHSIVVGGKGGGPPTEFSRKMALKFAVGCQVCKEIDHNGTPAIVDCDTGKPANMATFKRAIGKQLIAEVDWEDGNDGYKGKWRIPFCNCWPPTHPDVSEVPKNLEALGLAGYDVGQAPTDDAMDDPDL